MLVTLLASIALDWLRDGVRDGVRCTPGWEGAPIGGERAESMALLLGQGQQVGEEGGFVGCPTVQGVKASCLEG
jgi:hypothetical protein